MEELASCLTLIVLALWVICVLIVGLAMVAVAGDILGLWEAARWA